MRWLAEARERLRSLVFRRRDEREMDEELRFHLDCEIEKNLQGGLEPAEARRRALLALGGVESVKEQVRAARGTRLVEEAAADLRYALRTLRGAPAFSLTTVLVLTLGIGAGTALFSGVKGLLLDALAVEEPERLVRLRWAGENDMAISTSDYGAPAETTVEALGVHRVERVLPVFSYPMFQELSATTQTLSALFASASSSRMSVVVDGEAEIASGILVSGGYFSGLGVHARLGRTLGEDDDDPAAPPVAMISHDFWARRFGMDASVLGRTITVNNVPVTLVGVLPRSFSGIQAPEDSAADVQLPLALCTRLLSSGELRHRAGWWWLQLVGRLAPGVTPEQVRAELEGPFRAAARAGLETYLAGLSPEEGELPRNRDRRAIPHLLVDSAARGIYEPHAPYRRQASMLGVVVALVLLIVCTNVANLILARATGRLREIALRRSLGATRGRLVRQLVTEGAVLALAGGALGYALGMALRQLLPFGRTTVLDWRIPAFVLALSVVTGLGFSLLPALLATAGDTAPHLHREGRGGGRSRGLVGKALVVAQIALSSVLLVGAGLFLRTLENLRGVDLGFETRNLLLFRVDPRLSAQGSHAGPGLWAARPVRLAQLDVLHERIADALRALPGVVG
ncbi:MAG: ABC transporter permease, partial [Thermoanaerobaculia bacterium]|nr:ABC transporter permease [Thermoanaerobaculia bacterium]